MSLPKTLMQLAGASPTPHQIKDSALVIIDAQREYLDGRLPLEGIEAALEACARLLNAARKEGRPIFHVQHKGRPGGLFDPESANFEICAQVTPQEGEAVVEKSLPNAFAGTNLDALLKAADVKQLVVCGFMTHMCVSSTIRAGLDFGYASTVVASACATRALPTVSGEALSGKALHEAELAALGDRFAVVAADTAAVGA
ncbi:cysteine hydrolase family protein [Limibacillus halophilus]